MRLKAAGVCLSAMCVASLVAGPARPAIAIVNGHEVSDIGSIPFMASLSIQLVPAPAKPSFCGATIVNAYYVLTAAHCVERAGTAATVIAPSAVTVRIESASRSSGGTTVGIDRIDLAPNSIDLALLHNPDYAFCGCETIQTSGGQTYENSSRTLLVAGWGNTSSTIPAYPDLLQYTEVIVSGDDSYGCMLGRGTKPKADYMCTDSSNSAPCSGDSGGPLYISTWDPTFGIVFVQVGVIQSGPRPCASTTPGYDVYVRLSSQTVQDWLTNEFAMG